MEFDSAGSGVRVSDADRQAFIERLHQHTSAGRLTIDEFEERLAEVGVAKTAADLRRTLRELPEPPAPLSGEPDAVRDRYRRKLREAIAKWVTINLICVGIWFATTNPNSSGDLPGFWPFWPLLLTTVGFLGFVIKGAGGLAEEEQKRERERRKKEQREHPKVSEPPPVSARATGRVLATVLYVDLVDSTRRAAELGDREWGDVLDRFEEGVRRAVSGSGGLLVKTVGDGCLATFGAPAEAVAAALAIRGAVAELDLDVRAGVHTGEVQTRQDDVAGIAVHIGQRVSSLAAPGEVLVSRTVVDLVAGSGLTFSDRGEHELKGVPGVWPLFAVRV